MTVKLVVLKSGEDIVADVKELIDDDGNVVSLIFSNPVTVKLFKNQVLVDDEKENEYKISFTPWMPLSEEKNIPVRQDWIVTIVEPIEMVKKSYMEKMNGRTENINVDSIDEQYIIDGRD